MASSPIIGTAPAAGFALVDGAWLRYLAAGGNFTYQSGIVAKAGGNQTTGTQLSNNVAFIQVDTVASGNDSVVLPFSSAGKSLSIFNNGAQTLGIFASPNNNPLTGTTDVINKSSNVTQYSLTTGQTADFICAKNGIWAGVKSA